MTGRRQRADTSVVPRPIKFIGDLNPQSAKIKQGRALTRQTESENKPETKLSPGD